jgi:transcription elongation factor GreB
MSKAFTRESDVEMPEAAAFKPVASALPPGVKNYITPGGAQRLRAELAALLAAPGSLSNRQRIYELEQSLPSVVVVEPPAPPWNQVLFGASVTVRNQQGEEMTYRIVGVDETDLERDHISWRSPLATAVLRQRLGERVQFRAPAGEQQLEIIEIRFEAVG